MTSQNAVSNLPSGSDGADGRWLQVLPGERFAIRVPSAKTEGRYTAIEATAEPNCGPPLHIHHHAEEHFIILEGTVRFVCEGRTFDAPAGTSVTIPKGARHAFTNLTKSPIRTLGVFTPASGQDQCILEIIGAPDDLEAIAVRYGTAVVGPPIRR